MNKVTKLQHGIWKILAKQIVTTLAKLDRGFIHIFAIIIIIIFIYLLSDVISQEKNCNFL